VVLGLTRRARARAHPPAHAHAHRPTRTATRTHTNGQRPLNLEASALLRGRTRQHDAPTRQPGLSESKQFREISEAPGARSARSAAAARPVNRQGISSCATGPLAAAAPAHESAGGHRARCPVRRRTLCVIMRQLATLIFLSALLDGEISILVAFATKIVKQHP
jgi:hypothetical protein